MRESWERCDPEWDRFLARCPDGHHEQTSLWGEVKGCYGWQPFRIVVSKGNQILGGVQVLTRRFGRWARIGYVMRGPSAVSNDPELLELILEQLDHAAARAKLAYLVVGPRVRISGEPFEEGSRCVKAPRRMWKLSAN